jgi:ATP-dependent helicase/nuclease subunit A
VAEETLRTLEARQVAHWIAQCVQAGWQPGDVMVLSRRRAGLQPMQTELRALGIPAQIGEKTALGDCCEVQDVVALLDVLVSPQHDLSLARALKSPLFGLPDAAWWSCACVARSASASWFDRLQQDWPAGQPAGRRRRAAAALA